MTKPVTKHVELWRPAASFSDEQASEIRVSLMDPRAADTIVIDYDFERDGYRIRMPTVGEWDPDDKVMDEKLVEVAFIPGGVESDEAG